MLSSTIITRCKVIADILGKQTFRGKTLLELGARHGDCGAFFSRLGAKVTCLDRPKNLKKAKEKHPKLKFIECDLNNEFPEGQWDIITNMLTLHHLADPEWALWKMFPHSDLFIIESRVINSDDPHLFIQTTKTMKRQQENYSPTKKACTAAFFESTFKDCGLQWERHDDARLNTPFLRYDWKVTETKNMNRGTSRLWTVWR